MSVTGKYTLEEIEEGADTLGELEQIIAPVLLEIDYEGMGAQDVQELRRHLWVASDALKCFTLMIRIASM